MAERKRNWFTAGVVCDPSAAEAVESAFNVLEAVGTEIDGLRKKAGEPLLVTAYFETRPSENDVRDAVSSSLEIYGLTTEMAGHISIGKIEQSDWLAEWKKHWKPTEVGRFIVAPPWASFDGNGKFVIRIDPSMAFGTGTHETTKLCLAAIDKYYGPRDSLLDVGTGTGLLVIAAAMLGGRDLAACDIDPDSVAIARENAVLNGVAEHLTMFEGTVDDRTPPHDLVIANLTLDVISPILALLLAKTRKILVLSGILCDQESQILGELGRLGVNRTLIGRSGEWMSVIVRV